MISLNLEVKVTELPNSLPYVLASLLEFKELAIILVNIYLPPYVHKSKISQCWTQLEAYLECLARIHPATTPLLTGDFDARVRETKTFF